MKKIYIVWEPSCSRPVIHRNGFGNILAFMSEENAQAQLKDLQTFEDNSHYVVKEFFVKDVKDNY